MKNFKELRFEVREEKDLSYSEHIGVAKDHLLVIKKLKNKLSKKNLKKDLKEEIDKSEFQGIGTSKVGHHSTVHGHRVLIGFQKHPDRNEYEVDFHVNGQISKSITNPIPTEHGLAIADHVRNVVKSFVHHQKPDSLTFQAADRNRDVSNAKHELYMRGLKKLGATSVERHPQYQGNHIAHFKEHFQEFLDTLMEDASRKPLNGASRRFGVSMREDAPTNSTGPAIAGMSAQSEPGVKKSRQRSLQKKNAQDAQERDGFTKVWRRKALPVMEAVEVKRGKFAGNDTFVVPSHVYHEAVHHKAKGAHWTKYLNETEYGTAIRDFANKNPHKPIVLEDEKTGYLTYVRYGNKNKR